MNEPEKVYCVNCLSNQVVLVEKVTIKDRVMVRRMCAKCKQIFKAEGPIMGRKDF